MPTAVSFQSSLIQIIQFSERPRIVPPELDLVSKQKKVSNLE
jgi:hypothetical protein